MRQKILFGNICCLFHVLPVYCQIRFVSDYQSFQSLCSIIRVLKTLQILFVIFSFWEKRKWFWFFLLKNEIKCSHKIEISHKPHDIGQILNVHKDQGGETFDNEHQLLVCFQKKKKKKNYLSVNKRLSNLNRVQTQNNKVFNFPTNNLVKEK